MSDLNQIPWTDFFLVGYDPNRSFFQDAATAQTSRIPPDLLDQVSKDAVALSVNHGDAPDFRANIFGGIQVRVERRRTIKGEVFVCRRFPFPPRSMSEIGIEPGLIREMLNPAREQNRMMLFVGRTGSGKTTMASAFVKDWLRKFGGVGWTIENPIEIALQDEDYGENGACFQVEVASDDDFGVAIRDTMRSLPRLIFVGELRSGESVDLSPGARAAIHAATTGHIVVATMHANDIVSAMHSLVSLVGESAREQVADALAGVFKTTLTAGEIPNRRVLRLDPLFIQGETAESIRSHIRKGDYHMLTSEIERQKRMFSPIFGR
jgi:twitching motility protein PilT